MINPYAETIIRLDRLEITLDVLISKIERLYEPNVPTLKHYSRKQAASVLGVSIPMIDKLVSKGKLTRKKIGARTVFDSKEVEGIAA